MKLWFENHTDRITINLGTEERSDDSLELVSMSTNKARRLLGDLDVAIARAERQKQKVAA